MSAFSHAFFDQSTLIVTSSFSFVSFVGESRKAQNNVSETSTKIWRCFLSRKLEKETMI
jgi:hypothetical protein